MLTPLGWEAKIIYLSVGYAALVRRRKGTIVIRPLVCAATLTLLPIQFLLHPSNVADAAEGGSQVKGRIALAAKPVRLKADSPGAMCFVAPAATPLGKLQGLDPRPKMVVVLEGGPVDPSDQKPRSIRYDIIGDNFASDILPVVVGGKVEVRNLSRRSPQLYSVSPPNMIPEDPIGKKGVRETSPIESKHTPIEIRDRDATYFSVQVVAFENAYFSTVDYDGNFSISGVPDGTWKVKIWHNDGWVTNAPATSITVGGKRPSKPQTIKLPTKITTAGSK